MFEFIEDRLEFMEEKLEFIGNWLKFVLVRDLYGGNKICRHSEVKKITKLNFLRVDLSFVQIFSYNL